MGENLKGSKWARITSCSAVVISAAAPATTVAGTGSKQLTDEGEEHDSDGSVQDVRDKRCRYAKTFRDIEKQQLKKLLHRLFPQNPHTKRSECLERGMW